MRPAHSLAGGGCVYTPRGYSPVVGRVFRKPGVGGVGGCSAWLWPRGWLRRWWWWQRSGRYGWRRWLCLAVDDGARWLIFRPIYPQPFINVVDRCRRSNNIRNKRVVGIVCDHLGRLTPASVQQHG